MSVPNLSIYHIFLSIYSVSVVSYSEGISSLFPFNTLRHLTNIIFILSLSKYQVFHD